MSALDRADTHQYYSYNARQFFLKSKVYCNIELPQLQRTKFMTTHLKKPSMYLDQNALDKLRKIGTDNHFSALKDKYSFVYSNSTLREVHKAGVNAGDSGKTAEFIILLTKLEATYFQLPDILSNFDARHYECIDTPCNVYLKFLDEDLRYDEFKQPMEKIGLAVHNGITDYDEFGDIQISSMLSLKDFLLDKLATLELEKANWSDENTKPHLETYIELCHQRMQILEFQLYNFQKDVRLMNKKFKEANQDQSMSKTFRDEYCINVDNLKKIKGFNALNRIFDYLDEVKPENPPPLRDLYKDIFDEDKRLFNRVFITYNFLNLIGYYPDESLNKENKFLRSNLDRSHAMLGCFCDIFVTHDQRFIKKMKVIYEHFNIATKIYDIEVLDDKTSFKVLYDLSEGII